MTMIHRFILAISTLLLTACGAQAPEIKTVTGLAMGTSYTVKWWPNETIDDSQFSSHINQVIRRVEDSMSTYLDASDLSGLNGAQAGVWHSVPAPMAQLVAQAQAISKSTNGAFDITVGPVVDLWGFGPQPKPTKIPTSAQLEVLRPLVGYEYIQVQVHPAAIKKLRASAIDLSAIAKGYGVDQVALWLQEQGIEHYLVEIGGELRTKGRKPSGQSWRIAIESPAEQARSVFQVVRVEDRAIATSGNYRNYYEEDGVRYSHTLNPKTLQPVRHKLASVTVMADNAATADALATALMVMGETQGPEWAAMHNVPAYFIIWQADKFIAKPTSGFEQFIEP
ncbi:MAG TPA: FAD:protein FMN transferase ApbE [Oceanospirillaceae bacterium]|nr:FAD:protein FMN transferase ApbE [Oceanospirillaceae bacterium]